MLIYALIVFLFATIPKISGMHEILQKDAVQKTFCTICQENIENNQMQLSCSHTFHIDCIDSWFNEQYWCPLCRKAPEMSWLQKILALFARMPTDLRDLEHPWS